MQILLVEDNLDHAELAIREIETHSSKHRVTHVQDGEEALNYLLRKKGFVNRHTSPRPQLILLDLKLPKLNGIEVLKRIKKEASLQKIPVVILTSSENEFRQFEKIGASQDMYMIKPIGATEFNQVVQNVGWY